MNPPLQQWGVKIWHNTRTLTWTQTTIFKHAVPFFTLIDIQWWRWCDVKTFPALQQHLKVDFIDYQAALIDLRTKDWPINDLQILIYCCLDLLNATSSGSLCDCWRPFWEMLLYHSSALIQTIFSFLTYRPKTQPHTHSEWWAVT